MPAAAGSRTREVSFQIDENIRGTDVHRQPTCAPVDEHIMEMLIMIRRVPSIVSLRGCNGG